MPEAGDIPMKNLYSLIYGCFYPSDVECCDRGQSLVTREGLNEGINGPLIENLGEFEEGTQYKINRIRYICRQKVFHKIAIIAKILNGLIWRLGATGIWKG